MSASIQELDNTVRAFYEGKGDLVSDHKGFFLVSYPSSNWTLTLGLSLSSKNKPNRH
jgi:exportin-1